jgi:uncharacterized protein (TIGR03032 family)
VLARSLSPVGRNGTAADAPRVPEFVRQETSSPGSPDTALACELYVLNSGHGQLCHVDRQSGEVTTIAALPGYTRGLAFAGRHAFVGLSMIREKDLFGGLPIADKYDDSQRKCGVCVVNLDSGKLEAFLYFEAGTQEIFDIQVLPGMCWPTVVGFQDETLDGVIVAPPGAWAPGATLPVASGDKGSRASN